MSIHEAVVNQDLEALEKLLADKPDAIKAFDSEGRTPLHLSTSYDVAECLLQHGARPDCRDCHGQTPLFTCHDLGVCASLIAHGADVNALHSGGVTPLLKAIYSGEYEIALYLIRKGADTAHVADDGSNILSLACVYGDEVFLNALLEYPQARRFINVANAGLTPLHLVCMEGNNPFARILIRNGASASAKTPPGLSPIEIAAMHEDSELLEILTSSG
jgi:ankyrin repeat protein